jgi:hypothetical protein
LEGENVTDSETSMLEPNEDEEEPEEDLQVEIKEMIWTSYKRNFLSDDTSRKQQMSGTDSR